MGPVRRSGRRKRRKRRRGGQLSVKFSVSGARSEEECGQVIFKETSATDTAEGMHFRSGRPEEDLLVLFRPGRARPSEQQPLVLSRKVPGSHCEEATQVALIVA